MLTIKTITTVVSPSLNYEYTSLQKEGKDIDQTSLAEHTAIKHFAEALQDFSHTAALCELMNVVIGVNASVSHLAATLN